MINDYCYSNEVSSAKMAKKSNTSFTQITHQQYVDIKVLIQKYDAPVLGDFLGFLLRLHGHHPMDALEIQQADRDQAHFYEYEYLALDPGLLCEWKSSKQQTGVARRRDHCLMALLLRRLGIK